MSRLLMCGSDDPLSWRVDSLGTIDGYPEATTVEYIDEPPFCPYRAATCEDHCTAAARACVDGP